MKPSSLTIELKTKYGDHAFEKALDFLAIADLLGDKESAKLFAICLVEITGDKYAKA